MKQDDLPPKEREAHFRFAVVGVLLIAPLRRKELKVAIENIIERTWICPLTNTERKLTFRTVERWFYTAKAAANPIAALMPKVRRDRGSERVITPVIAAELLALYDKNKEWTHFLLHQNLEARLQELSGLEVDCPSYSSVSRYMNKHGFIRIAADPENEAKTEALVSKLVRQIATFECEYVSELFHTDAHHGKLRVLRDDGSYFSPIAIAIIDDSSRLICHIQWYEFESARELTDCFSQAILRRGACRMLMSDNGAAMISAEMKRGCERLSIVLHHNPAYTPWKNGKMESFWMSLEGQLVAMAKKEKDLTLHELNIYTNEWVDVVYNDRVHSETKEKPVRRFLHGKRVIRNDFGENEVGTAFLRNDSRVVRRSDATISLHGIRYGVPSEFSHHKKLRLRYALWDKRIVHIEDELTGKIVGSAAPVDRIANSDGRRPVRKEPRHYEKIESPKLRALEKNRQVTGRPPSFRTPKDDGNTN